MKGHFYKKDSTWRFILDIGVDPKTGKRKQKHRGGFKTKKEAEVAAAKLLLDCEDGYKEESKITFEDFAMEWLAIYAATNDVKISTTNQRRYRIDNLSTVLGKIKLKDITPRGYQEALLALKEAGYAANTLSSINATAKMIFSKAVELKLIKESPALYAKLPTTKKTVDDLASENDVPKYFEKEQLAFFLSTAKNKGLDHDYTLFLLLAYTGMRVGEVCALKWKDLDEDNLQLKIYKTYYNPTGQPTDFLLLPPKTQSSRRNIAINEMLHSELEKLRKQQNIVNLKNRDIYLDQDFIFTLYEKNIGFPTYPSLVRTRMNRLLKLAKITEPFSPHTLRHTHTSLLAEAGVGLEEIMERLGHKDDKTTRNIYLHITKKMKTEAIDKFAQLMGSF